MTNAQREQLLTVYQVERSDQQNASILNAAVISVALAYIVAVTSFLSNSSSRQGLGSMVLLTPFPVLSLNGYITLQVSTGVLRRNYLLHLESLLAGTPHRYGKTHPRFVALYHSLILGWGGLPTALLTFLTYWSPLVTSVFFTTYVVNPVAKQNHIARWLDGAAIGAYSTMIALNVIAIVSVYIRIGKTTAELRQSSIERLTAAHSVWT
jgi:hypothetical protein